MYSLYCCGRQAVCSFFKGFFFFNSLLLRPTDGLLLCVCVCMCAHCPGVYSVGEQQSVGVHKNCVHPTRAILGGGSEARTRYVFGTCFSAELHSLPSMKNEGWEMAIPRVGRELTSSGCPPISVHMTSPAHTHTKKCHFKKVRESGTHFLLPALGRRRRQRICS